MRRTSFFICMILVPLQLAAADINPEYEQVLISLNSVVPIVSQYGGAWHIELYMRNDNDFFTSVTDAKPECHLSTFCSFDKAPHTEERLLNLSLGNVPANILHIPVAGAAGISFSLRLFDDSDPTSSLELPVVRERDFRTSRVSLLHIPVNDHSRVDLRLYDPRDLDGNRVKVQIASEETGEVLAEFDTGLNGQSLRDTPDPFPSNPGYVQMGRLADLFPAIRTATSIRITITPLTDGMEFWAMASVTDNQTNRISLYTPQ
jgi:hypothetical protein